MLPHLRGRVLAEQAREGLPHITAHGKLPWAAHGYAVGHLSQNLLFARHCRGTFHATFVIEDWSVRMRGSERSRWTCPGPATGSRRLRHSARPFWRSLDLLKVVARLSCRLM